MKTILLVIDNPSRDLQGLVLLAWMLVRDYQYRPVLVGTRDEIPGLIRHKPDLILLPHIRYERHREILTVARSQNTKIAILPVEGLPIGPLVRNDEILDYHSLFLKSVIGLDELHEYVDLMLAWGFEVKTICAANNYLETARIEVTGCPRMDFLAADFEMSGVKRKEFCEIHNLSPTAPTVGWFASTAYAHQSDFDQWAAELYSSGSGRGLRGVVDMAKLGRVHQEVFDRMTRWFETLANDYPDVNFFVKPHPQEPIDNYQRKLSKIPNIAIVPTKVPSTELIRLTDIQINWRCTTSSESWLQNVNRPVISVEPLELTGSQLEHIAVEFSIGNDIASTYHELHKQVGKYLNGETVTSGLIEKRQVFIEKYFRSSDGCSTTKVAQVLDEFLFTQESHPRGCSAYKEITKQVYRIVKAGQIHRLGIGKNRKVEGQIRFDSKDVYRIIDNLNKSFNSKVKREKIILFP